MVEEGGEAAWQCSHIGGHNQAPISLFFPHGVNYGHTTPSEMRRLIQAYRTGEVVLHHYRGRCCYNPPSQAAEHFWREQNGVVSLPGMRIDSAIESSENNWEITVSGPENENPIQMKIRRQVSDQKIPVTCSKKKADWVSTFHRID